MKKLVTLCCTLMVAACSTVNKNTVAYQMSKYDSSAYYVVAGDGATKQEATETAWKNMQQELTQHTPVAAGEQVINDILANAKVEKVWRDKQSNHKHFFALAVLPREKGTLIVTPLINQADAQLTGLARQFADPADPLADLKVAYKMQPIIERRAALDDLYQFIQADRGGYMPENFAPFKTIFKEKMAAVQVGVDVAGVESDVLVTYVVDALNKMGLGVVDGTDPEQVLSVQIKTEIDNYSSKKVNGLIWCSSAAAISLNDTQRGATVARFNVYDRAGTSRLADSMRRSMQAVGEQAAKQIAQRLEDYLKTK